MAATGESPRKADAFPSTALTWLGEALRRGPEGAEEAAQHVMEVYLEPLSIYAAGSSFRKLGEPGDLVRGFFADRLSREGFLERWLLSGRPLRFWLLVAFRHYMYEQMKAANRLSEAARRRFEAAIDEPAQDGPVDRFEAAAARAQVRAALHRTEQICRERRQETHWNIFLLHTTENVPYAVLADRHGVTEARAAVMARTAAAIFRRALRDEVAWPGAEREQIDQELQALKGAIKP